MASSGVADILVEMGVEEHNISDDSRIRDNLGLDSTEVVELRLEIRERFGVQVDFTARPDFTVSELDALIEQERVE